MTAETGWFASELRRELTARNRLYARGWEHVESYSNSPAIVYAPEGERHGNFFDAAYAAMRAQPGWMRRFDKVHAQAARSLPKRERRWRELDSSMSSDALLMNIFCTPGVAESELLRNALGVEGDASPVFGWRARVPLANGRFDRTEVDLRLGSLLIEAKLTEAGFQTCAAAVAEAYRDFDAVFERELLPRVELPPPRRRKVTEFPEDFSQEFESLVDNSANGVFHLSPLAKLSAQNAASGQPALSAAGASGYASYQLIRNVLAAYAAGCGFCVVHDERRPDLREAWFGVMAAVKSANMRTRCKVLTWQELSAPLPDVLQHFLDLKYGIVAPGRIASTVAEVID